MDSTLGSVKKAVYTIIEKPGNKSFWLRIGWASLNRDGSFNLNLDALPINGRLQMRDWHPRDEARPSGVEVDRGLDRGDLDRLQ